MARNAEIVLAFPILGQDKRYAFTDQPKGSTPALLNCWPVDYTTGRFRGGVRPGLTTVSSPSGAPYAWARGGWVTGSGTSWTTHRGAAVTTDGGTYTGEGGSWTQQISTAPGSTFSSCAIFQNHVIQASGAASNTVVKRRELNGGSTETLPNTGGGTVPTGCGIVFPHQNRLVLCGDVANPHVHYWSATGDMTDWNYASRLASGAFASTGSAGGQLGDPITAGLSQTDRRALLGGKNSVYSVVGNPRTAGVDAVSRTVGPLMQSAWCLDDENTCWMMTRGGLYSLAPDSLTLKPASGNIPDELKDANPANGDIISVGYDHRWRGIHTSINFNSGSDEHWYFKMPDEAAEYPGGWFPMTLTESMNLCFHFPEMMTNDRSSLLTIGASGQAYQYNRLSTETFDSYVWIGFRLGDDFNDGIITRVFASLAQFSDLWSGAYTGRINWALYVGNSPEAAFNSTAFFTGTGFSLEGLNYEQNPMARGNYAFLKIFDASNEKWLLEKLMLVVEPGGPRQVA